MIQSATINVLISMHALGLCHLGHNMYKLAAEWFSALRRKAVPCNFLSNRPKATSQMKSYGCGHLNARYYLSLQIIAMGSGWKSPPIFHCISFCEDFPTTTHIIIPCRHELPGLPLFLLYNKHLQHACNGLFHFRHQSRYTIALEVDVTF